MHLLIKTTDEVHEPLTPFSTGSCLASGVSVLTARLPDCGVIFRARWRRPSEPAEWEGRMSRPNEKAGLGGRVRRLSEEAEWGGRVRRPSEKAGWGGRVSRLGEEVKWGGRVRRPGKEPGWEGWVRRPSEKAEWGGRLSRLGERKPVDSQHVRIVYATNSPA